MHFGRSRTTPVPHDLDEARAESKNGAWKRQTCRRSDDATRRPEPVIAAQALLAQRMREADVIDLVQRTWHLSRLDAQAAVNVARPVGRQAPKTGGVTTLNGIQTPSPARTGRWVMMRSGPVSEGNDVEHLPIASAQRQSSRSRHACGAAWLLRLLLIVAFEQRDATNADRDTYDDFRCGHVDAKRGR